jgi:2-polyprenyl-3-methyl-5-hydroxy-6-metoxy-1,4-benzoquinol methylase
MDSDQQKQTLAYFSGHADRWREFSSGQTDHFNVSAARHAAVLDGCATLPPGRRFLDVGCGAGQLVLDMARRGHEAIGNDFSQPMIDMCRQDATAAMLDATFECASVFDLPAPAKPYDVISAQGFIEYISPDEMTRFFRLIADYLSPGGYAFIGSRNRLFNLFSLNAYTRLELSLGVEKRLLTEALVLTEDLSVPDLSVRLLELPPIGVHPKSHPTTGRIEVAVRFQYTPAELLGLLDPLGLKLARIYPVHYHAFPILALKDQVKEWNQHMACLVGAAAARDHKLVPQASSFVLHLSKN